MPENLFVITDLSLSGAFRTYARQQELRGKGIAETAKKFMRMWVGEALDRIPPGDRDKVQRYLLQQTATARVAAATKDTKKAARSAALANQFRHTIAARIVAALNIYHARGKPADQFYSAVNRWFQRRLFAVNLHRAGLLPARRQLRLADRKGRMPRLSAAPGDYGETLTEDIVTLVVENWASARKTPTNPSPKGITGLAGGAFDSALNAVNARITDYVLQNMRIAANRSGFDTTTS